MGITLNFMNDAIRSISKNRSSTSIFKDRVSFFNLQDFDKTVPLNRKKVALITDDILNPFNMEIDFEGNLVSE